MPRQVLIGGVVVSQLGEAPQLAEVAVSGDGEVGVEEHHFRTRPVGLLVLVTEVGEEAGTVHTHIEIGVGRDDPTRFALMAVSPSR